MSDSSLGEGRRIVTCNGCGTPFVAVVDGEDVRLVGRQSNCPNCDSTQFSKLSL